MFNELDMVKHKPTGEVCFIVILGDGDEGPVYGLKSVDKEKEDWFRWCKADEIESLVRDRDEDPIQDEDDFVAFFPEEVSRLVEEILFAMESIPEGTELTPLGAIELTRSFQGVSDQSDGLYYLYDGLALSWFDMVRFSIALSMRALSHHLVLDDSDWDDMDVGFPQNIPFRIKHVDARS